VELVIALKGVTNLLANLVVKSESLEEIIVVNVKGNFLCRPNEKVVSSGFASVSSGLLPLSRFVHANKGGIFWRLHQFSGICRYFMSI
jgi:hypothetical protein